MSGHSKWANIKHRKGRQDAIRGKMFTRLAKEITIASREGGGDPGANPRLRLAMQNARAVNMPNDNITRAIKKGTGELEGVAYEEITYEGYAPAGVAVILETVTDNRKRTVSEVRSHMGKLGGNMGESNSVIWNFERKGVVNFETAGKSEDDILELVMEAGADDLIYDTDTCRVECAMDAYGSVYKFFEEKGFNLTESKLEYLPKQTVNITDIEDAKKVIRFVEFFEDHDDVQNVFSNFEIDDSIADKLD